MSEYMINSHSHSCTFPSEINAITYEECELPRDGMKFHCHNRLFGFFHRKGLKYTGNVSILLSNDY